MPPRIAKILISKKLQGNLTTLYKQQWWLGGCGKSEKCLRKKSVQENVEDRGRLRRCRWRWWSLLLSRRVTWFAQKISPVRWFTPILDCPPFEVNPTGTLELWRLVASEGHLVTRTTHPYVICHDFTPEWEIHLQRFTLLGGRTMDIPVPDIYMTQNILTFCNTTVLSFFFLVPNFWVDGGSLVSESAALGDIWQNLLPSFAYKLPHPPAAMSQPPKYQHHMWELNEQAHKV